MMTKEINRWGKRLPLARNSQWKRRNDSDFVSYDYTGSPDSEAIAERLSGFKYQPERAKEILEWYK